MDNHFLIFKDSNVFDEYYIMEELNRTNYSVTLLVEQKGTRKNYVLKRFSESFLENKMQKITEELETLAINQHPNIVAPHAIYQYSGYFDVLSEYCPGKSLSVRLDILVNDFHVLYSEKEIAEILFQLLHVISFTDTKRICHSDIKPENILFLSDDPRSLKVKIGNYGTPCAFEKIKDKLGSECEYRDWTFNSPSVRTGFAAGIDSDIWSAGCILFVLLIGKLPSVDENMASLDEELTKNKKISKEARDILRKMLIGTQNVKADELLNHPFITQRLNVNEKSFLLNGERNFAKIDCFKAFIKDRKEKLKLIKSNRSKLENFLDFSDATFQKRTQPKLIFEYLEYFNVTEKSCFIKEKTNKELLEEENANYINQEKK